MSFLFGSSPSVTSQPIHLQSSLNTGQTNVADVLTNLLTSLEGPAASSNLLFPSYTGQVGAPVSDATTGATSALGGLVPGLASSMNTASGVQAQGQQTLSDLLTRTPQSYQGYYNQNVYSPLISSFGQNAGRDIASATGGTAASATGQLAGGGTPTGAAAGQALSNFATTLGQTAGTLNYKTAEQNPSNILSALQTLQGVTGAPLNTLSTILSAGTSGQTAQQNYLDALYKNYTQGSSNTAQFLKDIIGYLGVDTMTQANQNTAVSGSSGLLGSLLGGVGGSAIGTAIGNLFGSSTGAAAGAAGAGAAAGAGTAAAAGGVSATAGGIGGLTAADSLAAGLIAL